MSTVVTDWPTCAGSWCLPDRAAVAMTTAGHTETLLHGKPILAACFALRHGLCQLCSVG